ncbi:MULTISPECIES: tetratricopeptide repeat protein [unclassified Acinetobacter]|uniref:tetratricopeptide repeat protein n=1 Tax=unclassified Acinetobacter TaxID=196816 RepID=UPI0024496D32|nr:MULTISPECIES: tetratricopeptide repeat protein [unclassified Acinetobacter]MDH0030589.1 sel1 repeat family protein [Acinetobacter sp. GD04021]MDH0886300.1 sel1 repeat family protein [Acinetobacter sp. GD03873]MDH1081725.1 sel1 repeat family protein [Acinetobacter sp. GD03983]MDH2189777.1 sel1 repeat family protein [Acinetobacter sp. GD03645]MDH2202769.1 sel1 repeat family protein [Acinetobacter sp. GD03647]
MKKLLIASLIMVASHSVFAADNKTATTAPDVFAKANQLYESKNYAAAFQEIQKIASTGNAQAIYNLGSMTQQGLGTAKDEKKALQYFQEASDKGFGKASFELAQMYRYGKSSVGINKDTEKYKKLIDTAAKQGSEDASVEVATLFFAQGKPEYDQLAIRQLRPLIQKNYYPAMHVKALYDLGVGVKNKNPIMQQQAINTFRTLASKGYAPSLMVLGNMMANGEIIDQNLPEAKKIFTTLAAQDFPNAKESLAEVEKAIAAKKAAPATSKK